MYLQDKWWIKFVDDKDDKDGKVKRTHLQSYINKHNLHDIFVVAKDKPVWKKNGKNVYLKEYNCIKKQTDYKNLCKNDLHLYEVLTHNTRCLYFDVDCYKYSPITEEQFVIVITRFIELINEKLTDLGIKLSIDNFAIKINDDYEVVGVKSFHLICKKYCMEINQLNQLVMIVNDNYKTKYPTEFENDTECKLKDKLLDDSIYRANKLIRCLGQSKREAKDKKENDYKFVLYNKLCKSPKRFGDTIIRDNKKAKLIIFNEIHDSVRTTYKKLIENDPTYQKELITISTDKTSFKNGFEKLDESFWDNTNNWTCATRIIKKLKLFPIEEWNAFSIEMGTRSYEYAKNEDFIDKMDITLIQSGIPKLTEVLNKCSSSYVFCFEYDKYVFMREQAIKYIRHHNLNITIPIQDDINTFVIVVDDFEINYKTGFITDLSLQKRLPKKHNKVNFGTDLITTSKSNSIYPSINIEHITEINAYVDEFIHNDKKCFVVQSAWGTGKSNCVLMRILNWVNSYQNDTGKILKICLLTPINSLACKLFDDLKRMGYISHLKQTQKINLSVCNKLICSPQSLVKAKNTNFDWIFLDEMNMILNTYSGGSTFEKLCFPSPSYNILIDLCVKANKVVMMDADIEQELVKLFISNGIIADGDIPTIIKNTQNKYKDYKFNILLETDHFDTEINRCIENDKKCYIAFISRKNAKSYYDGLCSKYPTKRILFIDRVGIHRSYTTSKARKLLYIEHLEQNILDDEVDIFIYTPTICVGTSINGDIFDCGFAYGISGVLIAQQFLQQLFRIRNLKDMTISILLENRCWGMYDFNCSVALGLNKVLMVEMKKEDFDAKNKNQYYIKNYKYYNLLGYINSKTINSEKSFGKELLYLMNSHNLNYEFIYTNDKPLLQDGDDAFQEGIITELNREKEAFMGAEPYDDYFEMIEVSDRIKHYKLNSTDAIMLVDEVEDMRVLKTKTLYKLYDIKSVMKQIQLSSMVNHQLILNGFINNTIGYKKSDDEFIYKYWKFDMINDMFNTRRRYNKIKDIYESKRDIHLTKYYKNEIYDLSNHDKNIEDVLIISIFECLEMLDVMYIDKTDELIFKNKLLLVSQFINIIFNNKKSIIFLIQQYTEVELYAEQKRKCYEWIGNFTIKSYYDKNDEHYIKIIYKIFNSRLNYLDLEFKVKSSFHSIVDNKYLRVCKTNHFIKYKQDIRAYNSLQHLHNQHTYLFDVDIPPSYNDKHLNKTLTILDKNGRHKKEHDIKFNIASSYLMDKHSKIDELKIVNGIEKDYDTEVGVKYAIQEYNEDNVYFNNSINDIELINNEHLFKKSWYDNKRKTHRYKDANGVEWYKNDGEVMGYSLEDNTNWVKDTSSNLYRPYKTMISDSVKTIMKQNNTLIKTPTEDNNEVECVVSEVLDDILNQIVFKQNYLKDELIKNNPIPLITPKYDEVVLNHLINI